MNATLAIFIDAYAPETAVPELVARGALPGGSGTHVIVWNRR